MTQSKALVREREGGRRFYLRDVGGAGGCLKCYSSGHALNLPSVRGVPLQRQSYFPPPLLLFFSMKMKKYFSLIYFVYHKIFIQNRNKVPKGSDEKLPLEVHVLDRRITVISNSTRSWSYMALLM